MAGSLILMVYMNAAGDNVTFSPRVAYGHYEPQYYPDIEYTVLGNTGIFNNTMRLSIRCTKHCRNWPGGYIDVTDSNQKAIYAVGPGGGIFSDDPATALKFHEDFGQFRIDMKRTIGPGDAPILPAGVRSEGTRLGDYTEGKQDYKATLHAVAMVFCFVGLLPLGVLILRLGNWVKWHALHQAVSLAGVFVGFGLGIAISRTYQRVSFHKATQAGGKSHANARQSRGFNTPHQIIGIIVVVLLIVQFVLGGLHHRKFKQTQQPTKLAAPHIWLGRFAIAFGVFNAFLYVALSDFPRVTPILGVPTQTT
jgi:hypothetical protein